ncbi:unnamed protein product [Phaedon cochleariae]|uniref:C2HC/C3H-type domain-containing protein n=1 Tax=Phaedon cochleariae TaxID=80249 RepID=A0A9P0DQI3_PHACE|nr:unnamed protein product [Phaedon cochleariae]
MTSKLAQIQARFQQKQMQEREEKLLKLYENQQQRAFDRVSRGSAGSNTSVSSTGGGKVRQMFDERRQKAGVDRSYPLEPLKSKTAPRGPSLDRKAAGHIAATTRTAAVRSTVQKTVSSIRNGGPVAQKKQVVQRVFENNNGRESYEEQKFVIENDAYNSKSHRDMIDMMNNHNLSDSLDDEEMPRIGFDEVDNYEQVVRTKIDDGVAKKSQKKNIISNGYTPVYRKESHPVTKKATPTTNSTTPPAQTRTSVSPRNPTRTPSSASSTNSTSSSAMGDKAKPAAPARAPTATRPSAKQSPRSAVARDDLAECGYCGRRFASDRIQKHEEVCAKTGKKKRKAYDATKHRVIGTELESYVLKGGKGKQSHMSTKSSKQTSKKDWRRTHEEFIAAIRAAKEAQAHLAKGGKLSDLPPPPPSSNPDYVQCPHCGRRFNESAAERHIPKCANFEFNKPKGGPTPKGKPVRR